MLLNTILLRRHNKIQEDNNRDFTKKEQGVENKKSNVSNFMKRYELDRSDC